VSPEVVVRERRWVEDAEAIAGLVLESNAYYSALAPEFFTSVETQGLVEWVARDADWLMQATTFARVAEVDGEFAGYLAANIQEPDENAQFTGNRDLRERRLYIHFVVTAEAHKRKGVATRLVEAAEAWARSQGVSVALCDTYADSPQSVLFWEKGMGYSRRSIKFRKRL
jgi:ribosomal protein S18 acetylase RimI-like enzyme